MSCSKYENGCSNPSSRCWTSLLVSKSIMISNIKVAYVRSLPCRIQIFDLNHYVCHICMIKLAEEKGLSHNKFKILSLGQAMWDLAQSTIEGSVFKGAWVMLQNCHLLTSWLKKLEVIIEGIKNPDKNFRLWLTTAPTDKMPLGILQRSLKVTTEPPDGLRLNMKSSFSKNQRWWFK